MRDIGLRADPLDDDDNRAAIVAGVLAVDSMELLVRHPDRVSSRGR